MPVKFDQARCDMNPYCPAARACPAEALHMDRKTMRPSFDAERCSGCGACLSSCPRGAVSEV